MPLYNIYDYYVYGLQKSATGDNTVGFNVLQSHSLPTGDGWYWGGVGILLVYALFFNNMVTVALAYLDRKFRILFFHFIAYILPSYLITIHFGQ